MPEPATSEAKAAMQELLEELDRTRREYAKLSLQLTQQDALVHHLKESEAKKDQVVQYLQEELSKLSDIHGHERAVHEEEATTKILELEHRNKFLTLETTRLTEENKICTSFELENRQLREALTQQQSAAEKLQAVNDELRKKVGTTMTDFRSKLETEFKKRLAEAEKKFRAEAYRALSEEAKVALQGNDHLQVTLQRQNDSIESVLSRCKHLETAHTRMKTEQDIAHQNLAAHQCEVTRLRKQLSATKEKNATLEEALSQRRIERASLELLYIEYEATRKELSKTNRELSKAKREADRWRARTVKLSTDLSGQADGEFERAMERQSRIDEQLDKERRRNERKARVRGKQQAVASRVDEHREADGASSSAGGSASESSAGEDGGFKPTMKGKVKADPGARLNMMDVLAIWNINFNAWNKDGTPARDAEPDATGPPINHTHGDSGANSEEAPVTTNHHPSPPKPATTTHARMQADRDLSVLSRPGDPSRLAKYKPHKNLGASAKVLTTRADLAAAAAASDALTVVNMEGDFATRRKKHPPAVGPHRFFVP